MYNRKGISSKLVYKEDEVYKSKITNLCNLGVIEEIKKKLNPPQLDLFTRSCFGHFLDLQELNISPQLIHQLLLREVKTQDHPEELWFFICGNKVRFAKEEYGLITGLNFGEFEGDEFTLKDELPHRLLHKYFGSADRIKLEQFQVVYHNLLNEDADDDDVVKLSLIYFLEFVLLGRDKRRLIHPFYMQLVDQLELFNTYPWGVVSYAYTYESLKKALVGRSAGFTKRKDSKEFHRRETYNLLGFPYAFQVTKYLLLHFNYVNYPILSLLIGCCIL